MLCTCQTIFRFYISCSKPIHHPVCDWIFLSQMRKSLMKTNSSRKRASLVKTTGVAVALNLWLYPKLVSLCVQVHCYIEKLPYGVLCFILVVFRPMRDLNWSFLVVGDGYKSVHLVLGAPSAPYLSGLVSIVHLPNSSGFAIAVYGCPWLTLASFPLELWK